MANRCCLVTLARYRRAVKIMLMEMAMGKGGVDHDVDIVVILVGKEKLIERDIVVVLESSRLEGLSGLCFEALRRRLCVFKQLRDQSYAAASPCSSGGAAHRTDSPLRHQNMLERR